METLEFFDKVMKINTRRHYVEIIREVPENENVIGYLRLSTIDQLLTSALANQRARLIDEGITLLIVDIESGKISRRTGFQYVMQRVRENRVKAIVITRLDRLGRTVLIIRKNVEIIRESGVNLIVIDQSIDLHSLHGMFLVNVLASLAEMEVEQTGSRIRSVKAYRRSKHFACDYAPFGYITENNQYKLNTTPYLCLLEERPANYLELYDVEDEEAFPGLTIQELARDCIEIFLQKKGTSPAVKAIVEKYGLGFTVAKKYGGNAVLYWSPAGLKRWLLNPVHVGDTAFLKRKQLSEGRRVPLPPEQWQIIKNTHPDERMLTDEEVSEIRSILTFNSKRTGPNLYNHDPSQSSAYQEFSYQRGLIYCDRCGQRCSATSRHSKDGQTIYYYYYCKNRLRGCTNSKGTRRDLIEHRLIEHLLQQSFEPSDSMESDSDASPLTNSVHEKLIRLEIKLRQLEAIEGFDPVIEDAKAKTQQEIERISCPFHPETLSNQTVRELIEAGNGLLLWHALSADEKVAVYPRLIDRITIDNGRVMDVVLRRSDAISTSEITTSEIDALEQGREA